MKNIHFLDNIKLTNDDLSILNKEIEEISDSIKLHGDMKVTEIFPFFCGGNINLWEIKRDKSNNAIRIKKIMEEYNGEQRLTLKLISSIYENIYDHYISPMTVSRE